MDTATLDSPAAAATSAGAPASSGADTGASTGASGGAGTSNPSIIESGADLLSLVPEGIFSGIGDDDADATQDDTGTDPETGDGDLTGLGDEDDEEAADEDDQEEGTEEEGASAGDKQAKGEQQQEELPEGVTRGKNSSGKPGLFVEDSRWKNIYGNHQLVQKATELLGEPATLEALQLRNDAFVAQEQLFNDLTSGDPKAQGAVLNYFFDEMARAKAEGEIGVDASVPMAQTFYQTLRDKSPDGYAHLRMSAARDLLEEMYADAAESGNRNLHLSAQHFAKRLAQVEDGVTDVKQVQSIVRQRGLPFYTTEELSSLKRGAASDPLKALREENARLRAERDGTSATSQAAQRGAWVQDTEKAIGDTILKNAISPALAAVEKDWSKFPQQFERLVKDPLHSAVFDAISKDSAFKGRIKLLKEQALRAPSAQKRTEFSQAIQNAYLNRAKLAVEAVKGKIFRESADFFKERVDSRHERRSAAQNRTAPTGATGSVPRSVLPKDLVPFKNGEFDTDTAVKQAMQLIGR